VHLDDDRLQRLMDGELAPAEETAAREHVTGCATCRQALAEAEGAERRTEALLRELDVAQATVGAEAIVARARGAETPSGRDAGTVPVAWRERPRARWRLAPAVAAALLVAAAAFAIPGSPVPRWWRQVVERMGAGEPAIVAPPDAADDDAGVAVIPGASLRVEFAARQSRGVARVSLTDEPELVVRAPSGAATYTWGVDRLLIDNRGRSASFEIRVPRATPRVEIRIEGAPVFRKEGARVTLASRMAEDLYVVPLGAP
jgi:hypothetical protein